MRRAPLLTMLLISGFAAAACSGSDSAVISVPPGQKAHVYHVSGFTPSAPVAPGKPTTVSFTIIQPNGKALTHYATGAGPHVGVHLIFVRTDLSAIVHLHPPIAADGKITQQVTFPASGPWQLAQLAANTALPAAIRSLAATLSAAALLAGGLPDRLST